MAAMHTAMVLMQHAAAVSCRCTMELWCGSWLAVSYNTPSAAINQASTILIDIEPDSRSEKRQNQLASHELPTPTHFLPPFFVLLA